MKINPKVINAGSQAWYNKLWPDTVLYMRLYTCLRSSSFMFKVVLIFEVVFIFGVVIISKVVFFLRLSSFFMSTSLLILSLSFSGV